MNTYGIIVSFLSSSELNRCKRNGLVMWEANNWFDILKQPWLTRKLRRKIGHLWNLQILPEMPVTPVIGITEPYPGFAQDLRDQYLRIEDHYLLTGEIKSQV